ATVVFVSYSISLSAGFISAATTPARQKTTPPADPPRLAPAHKEVVKGSSLVAPAVIAPMETPNPTTLKDIAFKQTSKPHTAAEGSQVATPITIAPLKEPAEPAESQTKRLLEEARKLSEGLGEMNKVLKNAQDSPPAAQSTGTDAQDSVK